MNQRKTLIQKLKSQNRKLKKLTKDCDPVYVERLKFSRQQALNEILNLNERIQKLEKRLESREKQPYLKRLWAALKGE